MELPMQSKNIGTNQKFPWEKLNFYGISNVKISQNQKYDKVEKYMVRKNKSSLSYKDRSGQQWNQ